MPEYALLEVEVSTLTPLHIGTGVELLNEYDYVIRDGKTWRINHGALLEAQDVEDPRQLDLISQTPPAQLLKPGDFTPQSPFFRYVMAGAPRASGTGAVLREQIKDVYDRPYLPGSSLKGALRTALASTLWKQANRSLNLNDLGFSSRFAAQRYERELLGRSPNYDLLRALHVSDSQPVESNRLMVLNARVINRLGKQGSPVEMEAIRSDTIFHLTMKVDLALFSEWAKRSGFSMPAESALMHLPGIVNARSRELAKREEQWFSAIPSAGAVASFYKQIASVNPPAGQMFLPLGWGTGWESKTFGPNLIQNASVREALLRKYNMARRKRNMGDPFPLSRRVAMKIQKSPNGAVQEIPALPLGWVLVSFKVIKGPQSVWRG